MYGCETFCFTLMEEHRLTVFENKVPKRDEVTGKWRRLHSEEFHDLYLSPNIRMITLRIMRWAGHVARKGGWEEVNARLWWGKPEWKRGLGGPIRRWEDNIKVDLKEMCWEVVDWIDLAHDKDKWRASLTLYLLTWRIWWSPNNAIKGQMGFSSAFKGLITAVNLRVS